MHYVHPITRDTNATRHYIGKSADLKRGVLDHNSGKSVHLANYRPWHLVTYIAFHEKQKVLDFKRYLESGSGSGDAFANRRLW